MKPVFAGIVVLTALASIGCHGDPVGGSTDDAGAGGDAGTDAGGSNLLLNGDFEMGCAGWSTDYATLTVVASARTGKTACMLCSDHAGYQITQKIEGSALQGGKKYLAEAWARRAPADGGATGIGHVEVTPIDVDGNSMGSIPGGDVSMTDEWQRLTAIITYDPAAKSVDVQIGSKDPGTCIVVDDASFHAIP